MHRFVLTLDCCSHCNHLVRVDTPAGLLLENLLDNLVHLWHPSHTSNQEDLMDVLGGDAGILHALVAGLLGSFEELADKILELGASQGHREMLGARGIGSDEGKVDVGRGGGGELALCLLARLPQALDGELVLGEVDALLLLELAHEKVEDRVVEILSAEESVAVGGLDFKNTPHDLEDGDIKGASSEIVDSNRTLLLVRAIGKSGGSGLVDDTKDLKAGDLASILGGLALGVVEVGRDGNNGLADRMAEVGLCSLLHLCEDKGADLAGGVLLTSSRHPGISAIGTDDLIGDHLHLLLCLGVIKRPSYQPLCGIDGVCGVGDGLALCRDTDEPLTLVREGDH